MLHGTQILRQNELEARDIQCFRGERNVQDHLGVAHQSEILSTETL